MRRVARALVLAVAASAAGVSHVSAQAQVPQKPAVLRIGMVSPTGAASGIAGLGEIRRAFRQASGLEVRVFAARNMAALIEAQAKGRVHYAVYSAAGYAAAQAACGCVEPLAAPAGSFGDVGLQAVVYARAGTAQDLAGAARLRVIAGPAGAVGPQVLAVDALAAAGAGDDVMFAPSLEAAELAIAEGAADVLVGWEPEVAFGGKPPESGSAARLAAMGVDGLVELWRSDVVRYGPHAVRADLPAELKQSLRTFLLHLHAQQPLVYDLIERRHLGGFMAVSDEDYASAAAMVALAAE